MDKLVEYQLAQRGIRDQAAYKAIISYILSAVQPLTQDNFKLFLLDLSQSGRKNNTINKYISTMRTYGVINGLSWTQELKRWKPNKSLTTVLSDEEIEALIALPLPPETPIKRWHMWSMFFMVQAYSGMRNNEVASLTVNTVDFGTNNFNLLQTKTAPRTVPIADLVRKRLQDYVQDCDYWLFPSSRGSSHVSSSAWHQQFMRRIDLLGIKRDNIKPYSIRHSWVTTMLANGTGLMQVKEIAGHSSVKTTQGYSHLVNKHLQQVINDHPNLKKENPKLAIKEDWERLRKKLLELSVGYSDVGKIESLLYGFFE